MKHRHLASSLLLATLAGASAGVPIDLTKDSPGKEVIAPPPASLLCFADGRICFDVEERVRFEVREDNFDFNHAVNAPTDDNWFLQRFRIGLALKPTDWLKVYVQGQDSREFGSDRPNFPGVMGSEGDNSFDLRQAYVKLGNPDLFPLSLTIGRQILSYGDERLVGSFDWNNFGRTFDAVKFRIEEPHWTLDLFTSSVVTITRSEIDKSDLFNGNEDHRDLLFSGLYYTNTYTPKAKFDLYFFSLNERSGNDTNQEGLTALPQPGAAPAQGGNPASRSDIFTLGFRINGDPKALHGFEYDAEVAGQAGKVSGLTLRAAAVHAGLGYDFLETWGKPRLYAEYNYATGDSNPTDRRDNTFQNLFPTNHKFYGYADFFSWENVHNPALSLRINPLPKVTFQVDQHLFFAATNEDAWYRANGVTRVRPINRNADTYEGAELDLTLIYKPVQSVALQVGYSRFWAGDYLKATGPHSDAHFGYVMTTFSF